MALQDIIAAGNARMQEQQQPARMDDIIARGQSRLAPTQRLRSAAQGMTFGFADELEAFVRTAFNGENYDEVALEVRNKLKAYNEQHPGEAMTMEMLGAVAPTALMFATGVGAPAAAATVPGALKAAALGATEAGVTAFGTGEGGFMQRAERVPTAAAVGGVAAPLMSGVVAGSGTVLNKFTNFVRTTFGDRLAGPVEAEIHRLAEVSGRTPDQVINDLLEGRLMSEHPDLVATLQAARAQGTKGITETLERRASETQSTVLDQLQKGLAPDASDNVYRTIRLGEEEFRKKEGKAYNEIFARGQEVSQGMTDVLAEALRRMPEAKKVLDEIYQSEGKIVPFYKIDDNGALRLVRMPTVQDAELVRRALAEQSYQASVKGAGTVGKNLKELETSLRSMLDVEAKDLQAVRARWRGFEQAREAFQTGRKALTGDLEEKLDIITQVLDRGNEAEIKALRAGFMNQLKNKFTRGDTAAKRLADEERAEGIIFRALYPDGPERDKVIYNLGTAALAKEVKGKVRFGSPTKPMETAMERMGSKVSAGDLQGVAAGHLPSIARVGSGLLKSLSPGLSDKQRDQVIGIIMTENPDILRRAFFDDTAAAQVQSFVSRILRGSAETAKTGILQQAGETAGSTFPLDFNGMNAL